MYMQTHYYKKMTYPPCYFKMQPFNAWAPSKSKLFLFVPLKKKKRNLTRGSWFAGRLLIFAQ